MQCRTFVLTALPVVLICTSRLASSAEITVEKTEKGAAVKIDGQLFTEYVTHSETKPILWPIIGPTGQEMTRRYPMSQPEGEKKEQDHPHQRSMWFTHGNVNGVNFWAEAASLPKGQTLGTTQHVKFLKLASGKPAVIVTQNNWIGPQGKKICEDRRTLRFDTDGEARWIDFDVEVKATDGPVTFADDKEGSFGLRVAESMSVDAKQGGKIVNSHGQTDTVATISSPKGPWGKAAPWVDFNGPIDGETLGIAIFNHPTSFRYPTYWHVRTYGLFAANPFGLHEFTKAQAGAGEYTLPAAETMTLRYRVYFHRGDEKAGKVAEAFAAYAQEAK